MSTDKSIFDCYQPLFDFMQREYGKTLLKSELDEIIEVVDQVNEAMSEFWRIKCDVEGCNETASTQGMYYKEFIGYACLCDKHSDIARKTSAAPQFKVEAIEREKRRDAKGYLPNR